MFGEMVGAALADCWKRAGPAGPRSMPSSGPAAERWRRCAAGDARAGFAGACTFVETSPVPRAGAGRAVPDAQLARCHRGPSGGAAAARRQRILRRAAVRQLVGRRGAAGDVTARLAFDRDGDDRRESPARERRSRACAPPRRAHGGVALIIDYGHARARPATRCRRCAAIASPIRSPIPASRT